MEQKCPDPPHRERDVSEDAPEPDEFRCCRPGSVRSQAKLAVKDEYTFDFLELADEHTERQMEQAILSRVEPFLLEMGGMFSFIGSQYRLEVSGHEYFIDLLLFHRRLRSLVALELKIGEFRPSTSARCSSIWRCLTMWHVSKGRIPRLAF